MVATTPHFLLFAETHTGATAGRWRFVLAATDGGEQLVAGDFEPEVQGERLELLSVVRGLEALDQPSRVTIITGSRYVRHGLTHGLYQWRENDWCWERFGELVPVKHQDLWLRVDRALKFHQVDCRTLRFDAPHAPRAPIEAPRRDEPQRRNDDQARAASQADRPAPRRDQRNRPARPRSSWWADRLRHWGARLAERQPALLEH